MQESFVALGVSAPVARALERRGITNRSRCRPSSCRTPWRAWTSSRRRPPAPARHSLLASRSSSASRARRPSGRAHPRPDPRARLPGRRGDPALAAARSLSIAAVYGGTSVGAQAKRARGAQILVATPGPPARSDRAPPHLSARRASPRPRRGGPHAGHGVPPAGRPRPPRRPDESPDAALLRDARRCGHGSRAEIHLERRARSPELPRGSSDVDRAWVPPGDGRRRSSGGSPRRSRRRRLVACLRAYEARRRQARPQARARPRRARRGHAREHVAERPRALARRSSSPAGLDAGRDRRCGTRARRRRHHACHQLRPAGHDDDYVHRVGRTGRAGRAARASRSCCRSSAPTSGGSPPGSRPRPPVPRARGRFARRPSPPARAALIRASRG